MVDLAKPRQLGSKPWLCQALGSLCWEKGGGLDGSEAHPTDRLRHLQYEAFPPISGPIGMWERYRNSVPLVKAYGNALVSEIQSCIQSGEYSSEKFVGVLSDENLFSYGGYEVNAAPLTLLIQHINEALSQDQEVEIEIVLTIREQSSFLLSFYSYDFFHQKPFYPSFDSFIDSGIESPSKGIFGMLLYDDAYSMWTSVLPHYVTVRLVPFERLDVLGGGAYVENFLGLARKELTREIDVLGHRVVNEAGKSSYHLRDVYRRSLVANRLRHGASYYSTKPAMGLVSKLLSSPIAFKFAPSNPTRIRKKSVSLSQEQQDQIQQIYAKSNSNIEKTLELGLAHLGYALL